ncbi:glutamate-1-semialdehyde 2,1-aminomutase [Natrialba magadii ATCC 43099]|uniref:Glutamate-1-semialdehyde 2,1-aminomutase n=1 Tax=Natrialba magadii (strain ATCC 43099 / DSM 3394 / CCM 3739 / CIP 104546 / IAM 13178 / JCM 8861 / NBRC 102185 / NCIMB 2190 / MS3) TaxID=547559 RepID=D3SVH9_NATMM|nr:glutamate-1-semialdehyde 2,1-aminomutase [Natrialba magadii]ADD05587.1 glutamate-1-semialdehyde 2,1-aminomutase [Natrialba magadii ATCC 43099]ELY30000.1 glutamate-1-semialdehyde aminotransferase [Natrialba magadii ATCC 43099]
MNDDNSRALYDRALSVMPGGVNSAVRAAIEPYPFFVQKGDRGHVIDADGNRYIDWVMGLGPLLLGHNLPESVQAGIQQNASEGPMYGTPTEIEVDLAEFVVRHVPSVEKIRFVNSGTEATTSAVRLARGYTGRNKIIVNQGGYHGAQDSTLVEGDVESVAPSSAGVPQSVAEHTIPVPFNDEDAVREAFEKHGDDIAAVMTEPILANYGIVDPDDGYHDFLREITDEHGSLLIFDEVITGFRVGGLGCAQSEFGVTPDLTTFGKVIGGGFPVGALGGRAEIMEQLAPSGPVFQAGTFSGHPVTMAAGLETLQFAAANNVYDHVNTLGDQLRSGLADIVADQAPEYTVAGTDSMFKVIFTRDGEAPKNAADVKNAETDRWRRVFWGQMKAQEVFLSQNQFECQFVSYGHTEADVEETLEAYKHAL